jgi:hypothetical protein
VDDVLISEIEPAFSPLVVNSILAVFLGGAAVFSGSLVAFSDKHSRRTNFRLAATVAAGVLLLSGGMTGWNIGTEEQRGDADVRFADLLATRFDATADVPYREVKASLASGPATIILTSGGQNISVTVKRDSGVLRFFSSRGTEYLPVPKP